MIILKIKKIKKIILIYFYKISCITIPNKKKRRRGNYPSKNPKRTG
jgi:hypothetical protein